MCLAGAAVCQVGEKAGKQPRHMKEEVGMHIYCCGRETNHTAVRFGVNRLKKTLQARLIPVSEQSLSLIHI